MTTQARNRTQARRLGTVIISLRRRFESRPTSLEIIKHVPQASEVILVCLSVFLCDMMIVRVAVGDCRLSKGEVAPITTILRGHRELNTTPFTLYRLWATTTCNLG